MDAEALLADINRRLANIIRTGTIAEVDHAARRVRVQIGPADADLTTWLKWKTARAGATRTWCPPTEGEQVMILSPSGEIGNGIVMPSIYCDDFDAPSSSPDEHVIAFPDGAVVHYNHASHALQATGITTALIDAADTITLRAGTAIILDAPLSHATGKATVDDLLTYGNGIAGTGGDNDNTITGPFNQTDGPLSSNGIVLDSHHHTGVQPGGGNTGGPA